MIKLYDFRKQIELYLIIILVIIAISYGTFRAYPILSGPSITIYSPKDGDIVASSTFEVTGVVKRSKETKIQGRSITTDTDGNFSEILVAQYPYTTIIISAKDSYGKELIKTIKVIPN